MKAQQSHAHHYVPQWYQKRFLTPGTRFFYLDLNPDTVEQDGVSHRRKAILRWGPSRCFYKDDLYTLRFGKQTTDEMERLFFGNIDHLGQFAVAQFAKFTGITDGVGKAFQILGPYMGAQRFRTPRGLEEIKIRAATSSDPNATLIALQSVFQAYATMWGEGVWEIAHARQSPTKFIVSDDPVTFYCKSVFRSEWTYPNDVSLKQIGTRTIFPLGLDSCLIITHLQLVRNPWSTPTEFRINARYNEQTVKHLGDIQFGRELEEEEVLRINYILKRRATRFIAAQEEEWLYPERRASTTEWADLDNDWFLFPHLWNISFTTGIMMGGGKAPPWASDEYGRHPWHSQYEDEKQRRKEHVTFDRAQSEWAKKRIGKSSAHIDAHLRDDIGDKMMKDYLRAEGLLPPEDQ
jgi:hypothetical protein